MAADRSELDRIHIRDLQLKCMIGTHEEERREKQDVLINVTLHGNLAAASKSDRIADTVNYEAI